jgi:DNA-binding LacI/PurR family transcriptional regulator
MSITIKDIARMSNVSIATVSRVINNKAEGIGEETRRKVLELVKELNYQPNSIARGLVTKKTNTIGLSILFLSGTNCLFSIWIVPIRIVFSPIAGLYQTCLKAPRSFLPTSSDRSLHNLFPKYS